MELLKIYPRPKRCYSYFEVGFSSERRLIYFQLTERNVTGKQTLH